MNFRQNLENNINKEAEGLRLIEKANSDTAFRDKTSPILGGSIAFDDGSNIVHTIGNTTFSLYLDRTDITDGRDSRKGAELLGIDTTIEGGEADHKADKKKFYSQIVGLALRSYLVDKDHRQAKIFVSVGLVQGIRDLDMQRTRNSAIKSGVSVKARDLGKFKTIFNATGNTLHTATPAIPEKHKNLVKNTGNVALGIATGLSFLGLLDMKIHVKNQLQIKRIDDHINSKV